MLNNCYWLFYNYKGASLVKIWSNPLSRDFVTTENFCVVVKVSSVAAPETPSTGLAPPPVSLGEFMGYFVGDC